VISSIGASTPELFRENRTNLNVREIAALGLAGRTSSPLGEGEGVSY